MIVFSAAGEEGGGLDSSLSLHEASEFFISDITRFTLPSTAASYDLL